MRLKLDENLPSGLAGDLRTLGHDVETVREEGLEGRPDREIAAAASTEGRLLLTQDLDFSDRRRVAPGTHPGILLLRLRIPGARALRARALQVFRSEDPARWRGAVVVVTDTKIRVAGARDQGGAASAGGGPSPAAR
ncbi:MAG: DUF5615 family PIN-like protein [Planctomycetes bacterium]|nr:DUF5615 family PIN-like protein [Planctomycetota bacterium]